MARRRCVVPLARRVRRASLRDTARLAASTSSSSIRRACGSGAAARVSARVDFGTLPNGQESAARTRTSSSGQPRLTTPVDLRSWPRKLAAEVEPVPRSSAPYASSEMAHPRACRLWSIVAGWSPGALTKRSHATASRIAVPESPTKPDAVVLHRTTGRRSARGAVTQMP